MAREIHFWKRLEPGDIVDVVAPASACKSHELQLGLKYLRSLGLRPRVPRDVLRPTPLNFSNSDERRFAHLKAALLAEDSRAVWCLRGGYGGLRLIPHLRKLRRPRHAKVLLGFSDVTSLHNFLNQEWNWPTLHSPVLTRMGSALARESEKREVAGFLFGRKRLQKFTGLKPLNAAARKKRVITAPVVGGNLAVLQSSLGTRNAFEGSGKIIFFEDINEKPYRIDRMLEQMLQAGVFERAKAVALGQFSLDSAADARLLWTDVIPRFCANIQIPVVSGLRVGHGKSQHTLPFMTTARLELGARPQLEVEAGFQ